MPHTLSFTHYAANAAENYQRYFVPTIPGPLAEDLIDRAGLRQGEHVLDVACGTGVLTRLAAPRVGPDGRVVGVDPNPGMLAVARSTAAPAGAAVDWRQYPAEALPLPDESFDHVLCQLGLMFFSDRAAGLAEMHRVLAPGGQVAINVPGPIPPVFQILDGALRRRVGAEAARFVGGIFSLGEEELAELLRAVGFRRIDLTTGGKVLRLPAPADFLWQYVHSTPLAAAVAEAGEDAQAKLEADVVSAWEPFVSDGQLTLDLQVTIATAQR